MYSIDAYKMEDSFVELNCLSVKRDWMDENLNHGAYNCFPLTLANKMGFAVSFSKDIIFEWNGETSKEKSEFKIHSGNEFCYTERGLGTIAFDTKTVFKTDNGISTLIMPAPNYFIDGIQCLTSILSTSFFGGSMHIVNKIMKKKSIIEIKAHTVVAAILPISISQFENTTLNNYLLKELKDDSKIFYPHNTQEYSLALKKYGEDNHRTANWYAKGIDHNHNIIGNHEINNFNFNIKKGTNV